MHKYFSNEFIEIHSLLLGILAFVAAILIYSAFTKKKINLNPKIIHVATLSYVDNQDEFYSAIRKGIENCNCMHDMQDWYRSIISYKKNYPDKESQMDANILLEHYEEKSKYLSSLFRVNY